jgi:hypothetical protein
MSAGEFVVVVCLLAASTFAVDVLSKIFNIWVVPAIMRSQKVPEDKIQNFVVKQASRTTPNTVLQVLTLLVKLVKK